RGERINSSRALGFEPGVVCGAGLGCGDGFGCGVGCGVGFVGPVADVDNFVCVMAIGPSHRVPRERRAPRAMKSISYAIAVHWGSPSHAPATHDAGNRLAPFTWCS